LVVQTAAYLKGHLHLMLQILLRTKKGRAI